MDSEIKELWVQALRSGDYQQGQGALRIDDKYSCLGVLCDLAERAGVVSRGLRFPQSTIRDPQELQWAYGKSGQVPFRESEVLPEAVVEWAGLPDSNPITISGRDAKDSLAGLNDQGFVFTEIADIIERDF